MSPSSLRRSIASAIVAAAVVGGCQRTVTPGTPTEPSVLQEYASVAVVIGSLRTSLGAAVVGAPIRVESRPLGCLLPVDASQVTVTGGGGVFTVRAYGPNNVNIIGCIMARDTLWPLAPTVSLDSVRFRLSPPYDTVRLTVTR